MKIMIASDVHGSLRYCREMLKAFDREKPDKLLLLGDILYHGPRNDLPGEYSTKDVAAMLNERKSSILCVNGNCDSEVDQVMLEFPIMAEYCLLFVADRTIFATHGHHFNKVSLPPLAPGDILLHGHTHVPAWEEIGNNNLYLNPGSVSIPKQDSGHSYMILDDKGFIWKTLDGTAYHEYRL